MASTVWRGFITFGLISIPVRMFRAARAERVSLRKLYRPAKAKAATFSPKTDDDEAYAETGNEVPGNEVLNEPEPAAATPIPNSPSTATAALAPVRQASVLQGSSEALASSAVVKGYEYEKNRYIALEPEDLKSIAPETATEMQIEEFVNLSEVDPVYFEASYYVAPQEAGHKAYSLLYRALQLSGLVAVAQFAMHSREHVVILRPGAKGLIAHTMFFSSEVRANEEYTADSEVLSKKELDLAQTLIQSLAGPFEPARYHDTYREKLEALIARRVAGEPVAAPAKASRPSPVVDIAEALQKSLAALKKKPANPAPRKKRAG